MQLLIFKGSSDDTFGEWRTTGIDYDNCASGKPIQFVIDCGEKGRLMVIGQYCSNGCWMVGVNKVEEEDVYPGWAMQMNDGGYGVELTVGIPDGLFALSWYNDGKFVDKAEFGE